MKKNAESAENIERLSYEIENEGKNKEQNSLSKIKLEQEVATQTKTKKNLEASIADTSEKVEDLKKYSDILKDALAKQENEKKQVIKRYL